MNKRRWTSFLLCLTLLTGILSLVSCDTRKPATGLQYEVNADGESCTITGMGTCTDTAILVPTEIDGYTVTAIAERAFAGCETITDMQLPDTVTEIGAFAFYQCKNITALTLPTSLKQVKEGAFLDVKSIETVHYSGSLADWCQIRFAEVYSSPLGDSRELKLYCDGVVLNEQTEITIPDTVTEWGSYTFVFFSKLERVILPNSMTAIVDGMFTGCSALSEITIPDSVIRIGERAFGSCRSLGSIQISNHVTSIAPSAFHMGNGVMEIVYDGTIEQWNAVYPKHDIVSVFRVRCSDGDLRYPPMNAN